MAKKQKKSAVHAKAAAKGPDYVIQVSDPKMLRKDILEGLREVIIFMQGYDQFRKVQEEKTMLFTQLKTDVRDIQQMIDNKLRLFLPKGKVHGLVKVEQKREIVREVKKQPTVVTRAPIIVTRAIGNSPTPAVSAPTPMQAIRESVPEVPASELAELEAQLKDIENQLQNVK